MSHGWGPSYGHPSHPTTGELPEVGDGVRGTGERRTVQVDADANANLRRAPADPDRVWSPSTSQRTHSEPRPAWGPSAPSNGWENPNPAAPQADPYSGAQQPPYGGQPSDQYGAPQNPYAAPKSEPYSGPQTGPLGDPQSEPNGGPNAGRRSRGDDTAQFARVGDGMRGSVGPITVQIDQVNVNGLTGETQLLPRTAPPVEEKADLPPAVESRQSELSRNMPARRKQMGPDWTHMPLRLLAATVVALAVLGASAASLISIAEWINP
ncbi:hypothetical protein [Glycomyces buryatensis]|uniref:Uncharacterized protein n=1 Tax=Glycomyces buryatensis TaxID=2570927 RepID=A0A4S8QIP6_9ACTN|nr:hypothetical protein [Glycomyces buryatensis]THV42875.1 hypothetical protein FAB82_03760 [Glycomyces buryatensis]